MLEQAQLLDRRMPLGDYQFTRLLDPSSTALSTSRNRGNHEDRANHPLGEATISYGYRRLAPPPRRRRARRTCIWSPPLARSLVSPPSGAPNQRECAPADIGEHHSKMANNATTLTVGELIGAGGHDSFTGFLFELSGHLVDESNRSSSITGNATADTLFSLSGS